jgi:hypothetical protein
MQNVDSVLQYSRSKKDLDIWMWSVWYGLQCLLINWWFRPVNDNEQRIQPSDLEDHRRSHQFLGPCCICPATDEHQPEFVEATIRVMRTGHFAGKYVASCASDACGYLGERHARNSE